MTTVDRPPLTALTDATRQKLLDRLDRMLDDHAQVVSLLYVAQVRVGRTVAQSTSDQLAVAHDALTTLRAKVERSPVSSE